MITFLGLLFLYLVSNLTPDTVAWWAKILPHMSFQYQTQTITQGEVNLSNIVFFIVFTAFFLFSTVRVLEARRWRT